ncbi:adenylate kinase family protein [Halalkalicoccus jeotgali]|uniref:Putative adenylate kinase n=1 Tax=Halalkalicoccus jeotgali (strain DSM 18796 / CECT 7217 / JCM 14584 / KCTC 4019 / B3) TaxID=795797 RepID=D8J2B3_HALJB|nr:adenylate kinase family protein [Halalkalicoccus jeotgali]ADJ14870.1 putative nucleotide kinase (TBD) [Halalkalicoccus jeotgali B3]ELY39452.1 putative nucleotide kinase [Halalkalicoccus jeotgali B3]
MRTVVTGTPGTGKTSATERLDREVLHLNDVIEREGLYTERDAERDSLVVDLDALGEFVGGREGIVESHLAHHLPAERVIVLRCAPDDLERRLRERGEDEAKAGENRESEELDLILSEAVTEHGLESVYEIDTTDRSPDEVASEIERVLAGEREPSAGEVTFS